MNGGGKTGSSKEWYSAVSFYSSPDALLIPLFCSETNDEEELPPSLAPSFLPVPAQRHPWELNSQVTPRLSNAWAVCATLSV